MWYNTNNMETIQEIKKRFTNSPQDNLEILYDKISSIDAKNEDEMFLKSQICKLMIQICKDTNNSSTKFLTAILNFDLEFFKFLSKKIKLLNKQKQWEKSIFYIQKVFEYYNVENNAETIYFDSAFDYYFYQFVFNNNQIQYRSSVCCYAFYNRSIAYKNLNLEDFAINDLKRCIKCSPMTIMPYYELMECYIKNNDTNSLKQLLNDYYKIIKTNEELSYFYYYYAYYFFLINNFQMCKICCNYANEFNANILFKTNIIKLLSKIYIGNNVVLDAFSYKPSEQLQKYNIPLGISLPTIQFMMTLYRNCLEKKITDRQIKKYVKNLIINDYKMTEYIDIINTNEKTDNKAITFDFYNFYIKINKKWKIIYVNNQQKIKQGVIFEAVNNNDKMSIVIDDQPDFNLDDLYKQNIQTLIDSGFSIKDENDFYNLKRNHIKSVVVSQENNVKMLMFFVFVNNTLCIFSINLEDDLQEKTRELIKVVNSISIFNSLKNKIN